MTVQGVGAKAALAIMGALGEDGLSRAISIGDWAAVKQAKGIGPKTAQRVINELKEKAPQVMAMATIVGQSFGDTKSSSLNDRDDNTKLNFEAEIADTTNSSSIERQKNQAEALSALKNLGYSPSEAANAIALASDIEDASSTPDLIKKALKLLSPKENKFYD